MKELFYTLLLAINPQVMAAQATEGNPTVKLIVMGGIAVAFIIIFVLVSKKMKKK